MDTNITTEERNFTPQFSLAHLTVLGCSVPELIYLAARTGYDSISPRIMPIGVADESPHYFNDTEMIRATRNALKITEMKVQQIELAAITSTCDIAAYQPMFEIGAELGASSVITSVWANGDTLDTDYVVEKYAEICDIAKIYNMSATLEFPTFSHINNLEKAVDIINAVNRENAKILIDTLYVHLSRVNIDDIAKLPADWFEVIQVSDILPGIPDTQEGMKEIARNSRLYLGEGCIDFKAIAKSLPPVHYSIELPNRSRIAELGYEEHARRCLQSTKRAFNFLINGMEKTVAEKIDR